MIKFLNYLLTFVSNYIKKEGQQIVYYCSIPLLILNKFTNIEVPEESFALFHFALAIFIFSAAAFGAIVNLLLTVSILYYKDKYNLELKFKNYPLFVRIIKYYEKFSYVSIAYEIIVTIIFILAILIMSLIFILNIVGII